MRFMSPAALVVAAGLVLGLGGKASAQKLPDRPVKVVIAFSAAGAIDILGRMIADKRSHALTTSFAGQWLYLRNLDDSQPDLFLYPNFNRNLLQSMRRETELLFDDIARHDRSILTLLTADYTFVDGRLARHYGIPNVLGNRFRPQLIVNRIRPHLVKKGKMLSVEDVNAILRLPLLGTIADEPEIIVSSNRGEPLALRTDIPTAAAYRAIAARVAGEDVPAPTAQGKESFLSRVGAWLGGRKA